MRILGAQLLNTGGKRAQSGEMKTILARFIFKQRYCTVANKYTEHTIYPWCLHAYMYITSKLLMQTIHSACLHLLEL